MPTTTAVRFPSVAWFQALNDLCNSQDLFRVKHDGTCDAIFGLKIGDETFDWGPHDIFVVPSWVAHEHAAASDAVIFIYSDRVVQEKLDFWREDKSDA